MSRDLNNAVWQIKSFSEELIPAAKIELGLIVIITSVDRTYFEQVALVLQGRLKIHSVNIARKTAGYPPLKSESENIIVSWTLDSKHIINPWDNVPDNDKARAVDYGILDKNGRYVGDAKADVNQDNKPDYQQLGELGMKIAAKNGYSIEWGGDPKSALKGKDLPHWQMIV